MATQTANSAVSPRRPPKWRLRMGAIVQRFLHNPMALLGLVIIVTWAVIAIFGTQIAPWGINQIDPGQKWKPPSNEHLMGTDNVGRDIFSRVLVGARLMMLLPTVSILRALPSWGRRSGLLSGYRGGWVDELIMRIVDLVMAFPVLMLYLMIIVAVGASATNVVLAITIGTAPAVARLVRGLVLDLRTREFVLAAKMRGETTLYILFREILPNTLGPILVDALVRVGYASFAVGAFGFLGLGVPEPHPDWGRMVSGARSALILVPTGAAVPGVLYRVAGDRL